MLHHLTAVCPRALRGPQTSLLTERERDDLLNKVTSIYTHLQTCVFVCMLSLLKSRSSYISRLLYLYQKLQLLL